MRETNLVLPQLVSFNYTLGMKILHIYHSYIPVCQCFLLVLCVKLNIPPNF